MYFPKNTTSCTQPCDVGIIQALKLKYREQLHNHILGSLSSEQTADDDPLKAINIALVMVWIFRAWKKVEKRTISKCFANRGFFKVGVVADPAPAMKFGLCDELEQEELDMQVREDDDKVLFPPQETPEALFDMAVLDNSTVEDSGEDKMDLSDIGEVEETAPDAPRNSEALAAIRTLQMYAMFRGDENASVILLTCSGTANSSQTEWPLSFVRRASLSSSTILNNDINLTGD